MFTTKGIRGNSPTTSCKGGHQSTLMEKVMNVTKKKMLSFVLMTSEGRKLTTISCSESKRNGLFESLWTLYTTKFNYLILNIDNGD